MKMTFDEVVKFIEKKHAIDPNLFDFDINETRLYEDVKISNDLDNTKIQTTTQSTKTLLHIAIEARNIGAVRCLLKNKANFHKEMAITKKIVEIYNNNTSWVRCNNAELYTPLELAQKINEYDIIQVLQEVVLLEDYKNTKNNVVEDFIIQDNNDISDDNNESEDSDNSSHCPPCCMIL